MNITKVIKLIYSVSFLRLDAGKFRDTMLEFFFSSFFFCVCVEFFLY